MAPIRVSIIVVACMAASAIARQAPPEPPRFRIAVDVVSIDAVVTDRNGEIVRDLTAADFEVFQSGKRQKVTSAQFVPVMAIASPAASPVASPDAPTTRPDAPPATAPPLTREQVRRTMVVVVDDLGLSAAGMNSVRVGLHRFVDTALLPTDLVAIVRTGESRGMVQSLTNNRGALHAAVDGLRYSTLSRKGASSSGDVTQLGDAAPVLDEVEDLQGSVSAVGSLAALNLIVQAARDLPGRKTVILASEGFPLMTGTDAKAAPEADPLVRSRLDRVIDQATRAGVVIYAIDGRALVSGRPTAGDDIHSANPRGNPDAMGEVVRTISGQRQRAIRDAQESLAYLAEQTGGFAVVNTNDLGRGLSRISNDVRDYYVIGYEPDRDTFAGRGQKPRLHKIEVRVRRPGVRVKTRKEFIGVTDPERPATETAAQQLVRAAISPFSAATVALHATHLPGYSPERGSFVRTVLHLDAQSLTFAADAGGKKVATVDLVGLLFNSDGVQVDTLTTGFDVTLENASAEQAIRDGLVYVTRVPIAKPGGYQLRYAIRDRRSGALGSVGGFVNIPDVRRGAFALSGVVLRAGAPAGAPEPIDSDRFTVRPAEARRIYAPGTPLSYSYEIYNAGSAVQAVASVWRGAEQLTSLPPVALMPPPGVDSGDNDGRFAAAGRLELAADLPAGSYVLQIAATSTDAKPAKRARTAVQRISFEVK